MRHIFQRHMTDCFPTCIAMLADIPHDFAIWLTHPLRFKRQSYATNDLRGAEVLEALGFKLQRSGKKDFTKLKKPAILFLHYSGKYKNTRHVAVWDPEQKKVLDPCRDNKNITLREYKRYLEFAWVVTK